MIKTVSVTVGLIELCKAIVTFLQTDMFLNEVYYLNIFHCDCLVQLKAL